MRRSSARWLLLGLVACTPAVVEDLDGDGILPPVDCDDADPAIGPHRAERCNGIDDDCDGEVDEAAADATLQHPDIDRDGFGDEARAAWVCPGLDGWTARAGDCDDTDPDVHPDAVEVCNRIDDDCSGVADDDAEDAEDWYRDQDGDDWGGEWIVTSCIRPQVATTRPGDCDDFTSNNRPDLEEYCDLEDNDCDGLVDEGLDCFQ